MISKQEKLMSKRLNDLTNQFRPYNELLIEIAAECDGPEATKYRWLFEKTYAQANETLKEMRTMAELIRCHAPETCNHKGIRNFLDLTDSAKVFDLPHSEVSR